MTHTDEKKKKKDDDSSSSSSSDSEPEHEPEYESDSSLAIDPKLKAIIKDLESEEVHPDDLPQQADPRCRKVKNIIQEWAMGSSCHGVPHMAEAHTCLVILVWSLILLICLLSFIYLFYTTMIQFLAYEKVVNLRMGLNEMDFPAVTICNINPYKLSKISTVPQLKALLIIYEKSAQGNAITA
uniref:Uncharacterized protein n=1 Tax=Plectus sambesii TaxID=2011161 RepID=A0A914XMJ0_9BILA